MSYAEERSQEKQIINSIAEQIALTMDWELMIDSQPLSDRAIIRKDAMSLYFRLDWKDKTRLNIHGGFDSCSQYLPYQDKREKTEITVSRNKPIERIVKDIQGRLLPGYEKMLTYALEMKAKDDEYKTKKQAELEEIAIVMGGEVKDDEVHKWKPCHVSCRYGVDTWDFKAWLPKEKLKAVLAIINE